MKNKSGYRHQFQPTIIIITFFFNETSIIDTLQFVDLQFEWMSLLYEDNLGSTVHTLSSLLSRRQGRRFCMFHKWKDSLDHWPRHVH